MKQTALCCVLALLSRPAAALDGQAFEAEVTGQTFFFESGGAAYGAEQYLPERRVIWRFEGGICRYGRWFAPDNERICFVYEQNPEPQCWRFALEGPRLTARFDGDDPADLLRELSRRTAPLECPGADLST